MATMIPTTLRVLLASLALATAASAVQSDCRQDERWIESLGLCARDPSAGTGNTTATQLSPTLDTADGSITISTVAGDRAIDDVHFHLSDLKTSVRQITDSVNAVNGEVNDRIDVSTSQINARLDTVSKTVASADDKLRLSIEHTDQRASTRVREVDVELGKDRKALTAAMQTIAKLNERLDSQKTISNTQADTIVALRRDLDGKAADCASSDAIEGLQALLLKELACTGKGQVYSNEAKKCVCADGDGFDLSIGRCRPSSNFGSSSDNAGYDCATILGDLQATGFSAKSGVFWINPAGNDPFKAWCDFDTFGGGWTLIESYDISKRGEFRQANFNVDLAVSANNPPTSDEAGDGRWDYYRLGKTRIQALFERSTEVHARCHRRASSSTNDWLTSDISAVTASWSGEPIGNYGQGAFRQFSTRGRLRGMDLEKENLNWYHGSPWHAGFDVGSTPGATSSEDSFTWHDGGLQSKHLCHRGAGDIVWMVRGAKALGSKESPAKSCNHILKSDNSMRDRDGPYFLGLASGVKKVFCDMTHHEGGWTMMTSLPYQYNYVGISSGQVGSPAYSKSYPGRNGNPIWHMSADDINSIRESYKSWGAQFKYAPLGTAASYWTTTPKSGVGLWGAESFHQQDCTYKNNQYSGQVKATACHRNAWTYPVNTWASGGHWWDNSGSYRWWGGYHNEGNHGTGSRCYQDGRGLGAHTPGLAPFHRGWCNTAEWGIEFVR